MRILYIPKKVSPITTIKYGLLYNWFAASSPATVEYGYLYNGYSAIDSRYIYASGWHIPTQTEFTTLVTYLGGYSFAGGHLKETGTTHWNSVSVGCDNSSQMNVRGSGFRNTAGGYGDVKNGTILMTSTIGTYVSAMNIVASSDEGRNNYTQFLKDGLAVRLIKDSTSLTNGQAGTYVGNDGKVYRTICVGTQEYIADNLMETKYRNGDDIPEVSDNTAWAALTTGARCSYNNTITNVGLGSRLISSSDWVVPSNTNILSLGTYISNDSGKLKETGTVYWDSPNVGATNETAFNGRGAGERRGTDGMFVNLKTGLVLWTSTAFANPLYAYYAAASSGNSVLDTGNPSPKDYGASIRLLYTGAGTPTSYTGNDGKMYRVITIGTQTWLADNLAETKYRDGSTIPEVTVDATWAALTTGARCSYNNDPFNV